MHTTPGSLGKLMHLRLPSPLSALSCSHLGTLASSPNHRLEAQYSWRAYWNYLRRQLYVLDTYFNAHNRVLNHTMMAVHAWASAAFTLAALTGAWGQRCGT